MNNISQPSLKIFFWDLISEERNEFNGKFHGFTNNFEIHPMLQRMSQEWNYVYQECN
jgi:hypothetical protein